MPYITVRQPPAYKQITLEEMIMGFQGESLLISNNETNTRTYYAGCINGDLYDRTRYQISLLYHALKHFTEKYKDLYEVKRETLYTKFYIPKKSGGLREINAPVPALMTALRELKDILEQKGNALYHTSAFAYVRGRSTIDAVKRHQQHGSRWFLKTDFSDFFGNTTPEFVMRQLSSIFPFSDLMEQEEGRKVLRQALDLCFLHGGLPQGTPISPMLTNLVMIPIDHRLSNSLRKHKKNFVYTRYADDILISSRTDFDWNKVVSWMDDTLRQFHAPFTIKESKTRYGSSSGSNWNLGVMLNKDNEITIGHKNKKRFLAMIHSYVMDRKNGKPWSLHDIQVLNGLTNYYRMVEGEVIDRMIAYSNEKFGVNFEAMVKADLSS